MSHYPCPTSYYNLYDPTRQEIWDTLYIHMAFRLSLDYLNLVGCRSISINLSFRPSLTHSLSLVRNRKKKIFCS